MGEGLRQRSEEPRAAKVLDSTDRTLISLLQRDGRASFTTLAKAVGLSEGAVRQRVQRLLREGTMQIVAVTDPLELDLARQAMIGITVSGDVHAVAEQIKAIDAADYVVLCAGRFDMLVEITVRDDAELVAVLNKQIRAIPGILSTETFMYLELAKQTYAWGTITD